MSRINREERLKGIYQASEKESPKKRQNRQLANLLNILEHAYEYSPEFKSRLARAECAPDDVNSLEDLSRIPVIRKKDLTAIQAGNFSNLGGLLTVNMGGLRRIYQSPGPIFDPEGRGPDYWGWSEAFFAGGFRPGDIVQMTFSYHLTPAGLMLEEPLVNLGCAVVPAGPGNTQVQIEIMTALKVTGFVGMASFLKIIADKALESGRDLKKDFNLQTAFVAAERLTESTRSELEDRFGLILRQGYGTADIGCIAYECSHLGGMHLSSRCYVEICDPHTGIPLPVGEIGEVVVTPFNPAYPLMRFATGDLSRLDAEPCPCGRTSMKLTGILGRVDDTAKVKGQFVYPRQVAEVLSAFPQVSSWQVHVSNPGGKDRLALRIAVNGTVDEKALAASFQNLIKLRPVLEYVKPEDLPADGRKLIDDRKYE